MMLCKGSWSQSHPNKQDKETQAKLDAVLKMLDSINFKQPTVGEDQGTEFMIRNP